METLGPPPQELLFLAPAILLATAGLALLLLGTRGRGLSGREASLIAVASLLLAGWLVLRVQAALEGRESLALLGGLFVLDGVSFLVQLLVLVSTLLTVLLSVPPGGAVGERGARLSRFFALLLLAAAGLLILASGTGPLLLWSALAGALAAAGIALRVALVPLQVRRRTDLQVPTTVLALLGSACPAAVFAALLRVLPGLENGGVRWQPAAAALAGAALIGGSLAAFGRDGARRMLAAGSLVHAGALLTGLLVADRGGLPAALFYLSAATAALLGAFGAEVRRERRAPLADTASAPAAATLLFLLALAGLPLTGGFVGQLGLLAAALRSWPGLAATAAVTSALLLAAALRRLAALDQGRLPLEAAPPRAPAVTAAVLLCAALVLALGLVPAPFLAWTESLSLAGR